MKRRPDLFIEHLQSQYIQIVGFYENIVINIWIRL